MSLLDNPNDWSNEFDETPPRQWERLDTDGRFWFDNSSGSMNSEGSIIYIGAAPLSGTLTVFWEIVTPPPHGDMRLMWDIGAGYLTEIITNQTTGSIDIDLTGATQLWIKIDSDEVNVAPYTYGSQTAIAGGNTSFFGELLWDEGTEGSNPITSYSLERQVDGGGYTEIYNNSIRHYHDFQMLAGSVYDYRVKAIDSEDNSSDWSNIVTLSPMLPNAVTVVGEIVGGDGSDIASFTWDEVADTTFAVQQYDLYLSVNSGSFIFYTSYFPGDSMFFEYGIDVGATVTIEVVTVDSAGLSNTSADCTLENIASLGYFEFIAGTDPNDSLHHGVHTDDTDGSFGTMTVPLAVGAGPYDVVWGSHASFQFWVAFTGSSSSGASDFFETFRIYSYGEAGLAFEYMGTSGGGNVAPNISEISVTPNVLFQFSTGGFGGFAEGRRYRVYLDDVANAAQTANVDFIMEAWTGFIGVKLSEGKGSIVTDIGTYLDDEYTLDAFYVDMANNRLIVTITGILNPPSQAIQIIVNTDAGERTIINGYCISQDVSLTTTTYTFDAFGDIDFTSLFSDSGEYTAVIFLTEPTI